MRSLTRWLYRMARLSNDIGTLTSGKPSRMARRIGNKFLGRNIWRRLTLKGRR